MYRYFFITSTVDGEWIYQCSWVESIKGVKYGKRSTSRLYPGRDRTESFYVEV